MRSFLFSILSFFVTLSMLSSCLDDTEYTYYNDAAITSFALGALDEYFTVVTSSGADSTYKRTLNCSGYSFYIDHLNELIWNEDSLPIEIDPTKVVCTITARNGGTIAIKSMTSDTLSYYSSSDSIDFSEPREFYVYGTTGQTWRSYTISVNVHKEVADTCIWERMLSGNEDLAALTGMKALSNGENIYLFGSDGSSTRLYTTAVTDGVTWAEVMTAPVLSAASSKNTIMKGDVFFTYSNGQVLKSEDAVYWDAVADVDLKQLVGASTANIYALSSDGGNLMSSADDGVTWAVEKLDEDNALLPQEDISFACRALETNVNTDKIVLIGNRYVDDYPDDTTAVVWSKIDEYSPGSRINAWNFVNFAGDNVNHRPPRADNWQIVNYDENSIKAMCGRGKAGTSAVAFDRIYHSGDDGITWRNDSVMTVPDGFSSSETAFAFVADKVNSVWIICGGTGQVWKGHINRVAWKKDQEYFLE